MPNADAAEQGSREEHGAGKLGSQDRRAVGRRRLSVEVSPDLHRRILTICSTRRVPVNQAVREVLERAFPG